MRRDALCLLVAERLERRRQVGEVHVEIDEAAAALLVAAVDVGALHLWLAEHRVVALLLRREGRPGHVRLHVPAQPPLQLGGRDQADEAVERRLQRRHRDEGVLDLAALGPEDVAAEARGRALGAHHGDAPLERLAHRRHRLVAHRALAAAATATATASAAKQQPTRGGEELDAQRDAAVGAQPTHHLLHVTARLHAAAALRAHRVEDERRHRPRRAAIGLGVAPILGALYGGDEAVEVGERHWLGARLHLPQRRQLLGGCRPVVVVFLDGVASALARRVSRRSDAEGARRATEARD